MNKRLLISALFIGLVARDGYAQDAGINVDHATKNIFTSAQMFLSAAMVLPPKINAIVSALGPVVTDVEKQIEIFNGASDILIKLDAVASLFDKTAIALELVIGSYLPAGGTTDYGKHNFSGIVKDIGQIVAISDAEVGTKILQILPLVQEKVAYIDVIAQSLHEMVTDITQAAKTRSSIFEQTQALMIALNNLPVQINLITSTFNGVIAQLKADYAILMADGALPVKVDAIADVVNQVAIVAELCVGSKLLPNSTVDLASHSFAGVLNDFDHVLTTLDPETGAQLSTVLAFAHDKVGYLDLVSSALHKVASNLAKITHAQ